MSGPAWPGDRQDVALTDYDPHAQSPESVQRERLTRRGLVYGFLGVIAFSLTLPMSRVAVSAFGPVLVGPGRAIIAAVLAGAALFLRRTPLPARRHFVSLGVIGVGAILAFPYLSAWAMDRLPASHGAVELALLPLATAGVSTVRNGEHPSPRFWLFSVLGAATVVGYSVYVGLGGIHLADLALLLAVALVAFAYAEGGRLARELGGWQVIAFAILLSMPVVIPLVTVTLARQGMADLLHAPAVAWVSLLYLGIFSQFIGFVGWYTGMDLGGVARVSQLQYVQPFLTLMFAWVLLGERLSIATVAASVLVVVLVIAGKRAPVRT